MALWRSITGEFDVSDSAGRELLCLACQALDRAEAIRDLIDHVGEGSITESGVVRANPMLKDELACRAFVAKQLERLGVNQEPTKAVGRPAETWSVTKTDKQTA